MAPRCLESERVKVDIEGIRIIVEAGYLRRYPAFLLLIAQNGLLFKEVTKQAIVVPTSLISVYFAVSVSLTIPVLRLG